MEAEHWILIALESWNLGIRKTSQESCSPHWI